LYCRDIDKIELIQPTDWSSSGGGGSSNALNMVKKGNILANTDDVGIITGYQLLKEEESYYTFYPKDPVYIIFPSSEYFGVGTGRIKVQNVGDEDVELLPYQRGTKQPRIGTRTKLKPGEEKCGDYKGRWTIAIVKGKEGDIVVSDFSTGKGGTGNAWGMA